MHAPIRAMFGQARYYLPGWRIRVLYTANLVSFRKAGISCPVSVAIDGDRFDMEQSAIVRVPKGIRWLVWFCQSDAQSYSFDSSWTRASLTGE